MNILYYCDEYPPARNGGIGTVVKLIAEAFSQRGHNVVVAGKYWNGKGRKTIEQVNGVTIVRWHKTSFYSLATAFLTLFRTNWSKDFKAQLIFYKTHKLLKKLVDHYSIDIVEVPDYVDEFLHHNGLRTPNWRSRIPKVIRVHGSVSFLYYYLNGSPDEKKIEQDREYFNKADAVYAVSSFSERYVTEHLCKWKEVKVIYNPIGEHWFKQSSDNNDSNIILFFGKIATMKGVYSLVKAFNLVAAISADAKLKLIGNGNPEAAKELVDSRFYDRVEFAGFMSQEHIMEEIDRSAFCVLPSFFENFSMAALEVLARRKALIYTSRTSGPELIEDGVNGFIVDPDDIEMLADKMCLLLLDHNLRDCLAVKGFEMCKQRFSTTVIIPQLELYYKELTEKCAL